MELLKSFEPYNQAFPGLNHLICSISDFYVEKILYQYMLLKKVLGLVQNNVNHIVDNMASVFTNHIYIPLSPFKHLHSRYLTALLQNANRFGNCYVFYFRVLQIT